MNFLQAITVSYISATDTKGTRYRARCRAGSITIAADYSLPQQESQYIRAKDVLCRHLKWCPDNFSEGGILHNDNYVFVWKQPKSQ